MISNRSEITQLRSGGYTPLEAFALCLKRRFEAGVGIKVLSTYSNSPPLIDPEEMANLVALEEFVGTIIVDDVPLHWGY